MQLATITLLVSSLAIVASAASYGYGAAPAISYGPAAYVAAPAYAELKLAKKPIIPIVHLYENMDNYGSYSVDALSADGTSQSESGSENGGSVKSGSFSWISPEGIQFSLSYTADENGFRPVASHLPVPPPVPAEIAAMLKTLPAEAPVALYSGSYANDYGSYGSYSSPSMMPADKKPSMMMQKPLNNMMMMSKPAPAPLSVPILTPPKAPTKTLVKTPEFFIDSDNSKTIVKIGKQ